ncbi:MAG: hypothetical protein R3E79_45955 [Caldilineaceae bacterium]
MSTPNQPLLHENLPLIEVNDSLILDDLYVDTRAAECLRLRLSPTVAVVDPDKMDDLLARLRKLDHTPKVVA